MGQEEPRGAGGTAPHPDAQDGAEDAQEALPGPVRGRTVLRGLARLVPVSRGVAALDSRLGKTEALF